jgi:hypothetical protein
VDAAAIPTSAVVAYALGLGAWLAGGLALATTLVWPPTRERGWERVDDADSGTQ